jgi:hypothetical protein
MAGKYFGARIADVFGGEVDPADVEIDFRLYGRDAILGTRDPARDVPPHELGVLIIVTAPTRQIAHDRDSYDLIVGSGAITADVFAELYGADPELTIGVNHPAAHAVKVSFPRPVRQGDLRDTDGYGGQFYAPLVDSELGAQDPQASSGAGLAR